MLVLFACMFACTDKKNLTRFDMEGSHIKTEICDGRIHTPKSSCPLKNSIEDFAPVEDMVLKAHMISKMLSSDMAEDVPQGPQPDANGQNCQLHNGEINAKERRCGRQETRRLPDNTMKSAIVLHQQHDGKCKEFFSSSLQCSQCCRCFTSEKALHVHLTKSKNCGSSVPRDSFEVQSNPYECGICSRAFHSMRLLSAHMCQPKNRMHLFQCLICSDVFTRAALLSTHVASHNIQKAFKCGVCEESFHENALLLDHIEASHKDLQAIYNCSICQLVFRDVSSLEEHVKGNHPSKGKEYRCGICSKQFSYKLKFSNHVAGHSLNNINNTPRTRSRVRREKQKTSQIKGSHKSKMQKPKKVKKSSQKKDIQEKKKFQMAKVSSDEEDTEMPDLEADTLYGDENLEEECHTDELVDGSVYDCDECGMRFSSPQSLSTHREFHPSNNNYSVDCDKCSTTFESLNLLKAHLKETSCPGYKCSQCSRSFPLEALLLVHVAKAHSDPNEELMTCDKCSKEFKTMLKFSRHAGTHAENKPFLCKMCGHRYAHPDHLFVHLKKIHGVDKEKCIRKRVQCKVCYKEFVDETALSTHNKNHTISELHDASKKKEVEEEPQEDQSTLESAEVTDLENTENKVNGYFDCDVCGERQFDVKDFVRHRNNHFFNGKFSIQCHCCKEIFNQVSEVKKHVKMKKCQGFKCSKCKRSFGLQTALLSHEAKEHNTHEASDSGQYKCLKCLKAFDNRMAYIRHAATHANVKSFQCNLCNSWYTTVEYVQTHIRLSHKPANESNNMKHNCPDCHTTFRSYEALETHKKYHINVVAKSEESLDKCSGGSYFSCNNCPKVFWRYNALVKHMKSHLKSLTKKKKSLMCTICKKTFRENYELQRHVGTHTRPYLCSSCGKSFSLPWSLKEHMKAYHSKENPYKCEFCLKDYSTSNSLRLHRRIHTGEKNFQCEYCEKVFVDLSYLKSHLKSHFPDKPFKCTLCSYSSKHKSGLSRHMLSHRQEKNHFCPICDKAFTQRGHVKTHMKLHSKVKNHVCSVCNSAFARHDYLKIHMRTHTNEKPYNCPVCSRAFAMSSNMLSHIKKTHPEYNYQYKHLRVNYSDQNASKVHENAEAMMTNQAFSESSVASDSGGIQPLSSPLIPVVEDRILHSVQIERQAQVTNLEQPLPVMSRQGGLDSELTRLGSVDSNIARPESINNDLVRHANMGGDVARFAGIGADLMRSGVDIPKNGCEMTRHANNMSRPVSVGNELAHHGNEMQRLGNEIPRHGCEIPRQGTFVAPGQEYMYVYPSFPQGPYMQDFLQPYHKP